MPEVTGAEAASRGPEPARAAADSPRGRARRVLLGRRVRRDRPSPVADPRRRRPRCRRGLSRQPERPQPRRDDLRPGVPEGARLEEHLLGEHRRPDAEAGRFGADVRHRAQRAGARRRPHRPPADPRRQPARLERVAADRARHAWPPAGDSRARRQGRRHRPAALADRRGGGRAPLHPSRDRRAAPVRDRQRPDLGGVGRGGRPRRAPRRPRADRGAGGGIRAGEGRRGHRHRGDRDRAHRARVRRCRARRMLRADRDHDPVLRDACELARRRPQRPHRQPRPRGRGDVPARGRRPAQLGRRRRQRQGRSHRPLDEPRPRASRGVRRASGRRPRRRDRDARGGAGAGADHDCRQPGCLDPRCRAARARDRGARLHARDSTSTSTRRPATPM